LTKKVRERESDRARVKGKEQDGERLRENLTENKSKIFWAQANERESEKQSKRKREREEGRE